jgi:hypothetical protein
MDMSWKNCWDCPVPLWGVLLQFGLLFLAGAAGAWLLKRRGSGLRELGIVIIALSVLWAAAITRIVPRWGILRWGTLRNIDQIDIFTQRTAYLIFAVLDATLISVIAIVRHLASSHYETTDVS